MKVGIGWGDGAESRASSRSISGRRSSAQHRQSGDRVRTGSDKSFADWSQLLQVLSVVIPTADLCGRHSRAGIYLSSLILIAVFMLWLGRYSIGMSAVVSIGVTVATYLMFEKWFLVPLPKGPIEDFFGLYDTGHASAARRTLGKRKGTMEEIVNPVSRLRRGAAALQHHADVRRHPARCRSSACCRASAAPTASRSCCR
jgi:hypothetical protein